MDNWDKAVNVFQTLADRYENSELMTAQNKMSAYNIGTHVFKNMEIPVLTNDESTKEYIKEFQLQKPENMIRFFVEANFAAFESTKESINELKLTILNETITDVSAAKDHIADAINNKEDEEKELEAAKNLLDRAINGLQSKIKENIESIRKIDSRGKWQFFLKSKVSLTDIDTAVSSAELALRALIAAVEAQRQIVAIKKRTDDPASVVKCYQFIEAEILDGDTCLLMHAYDKDKAAGFWTRIKQICKSIIKDENNLVMYADEYDDIDFS